MTARSSTISEKAYMCQQIHTIASGSILRRIAGVVVVLINVVLFPHSLVFDIAIGTSVPGTLFPARQPVEHQKGGRLTEALYRGASCPIDNISTIHPRAERCRFVLLLATTVLPPLQPRTLLSHFSFFSRFSYFPHFISHRKAKPAACGCRAFAPPTFPARRSACIKGT